MQANPNIVMPPGDYELPTRPVEDACTQIFAYDSGTNSTLYEYQPGNGTRYIVSIIDMTGLPQEARDMMETPHEHLLIVHNMGTRRAVPVSRKVQYYDLEDLGLGVADVLALVKLVHAHVQGRIF